MGCTPRGPTGDRGPQPPARFGDFSAVKSPPPEAWRKTADAHSPSRLRRPLRGAGGHTGHPYTGAATRRGPMWASAPTKGEGTNGLAQPLYSSREAAYAARADVASAPTGKSLPDTFYGGALLPQAFGRAMRAPTAEMEGLRKKSAVCKI